MENALAKQAMLQRTITRALENFKKIGKANVTAAKARSRINQLEKAWEEFQQGHAILLASTPEEQQGTISYFAEDQLEPTEEAFYAARDYMADCLETLEPPVSQSLQSSIAPPPGHASSGTAAVSLAHLPPVQLPPFDGDCNEWETFRDRFTALIMSNPELSDFLRMHFLVSSLKGRALDAIKNIPVKAENLAIAWRTLTTRFENKRRLINQHLANLINLTAVKRESSGELRSLVDKANVAVTSLTHLGRTPAELWIDMLVHLVSQKLDAATLKAWTLATPQSDQMPTFDDLTRFVESRARALEEIASQSPVAPVLKPPGNPRVHAANVTTSRASDTSAKSSTAPVKKSCPRCESRHYLHACPRYLADPLSRRREFVVKANRCFNCLSEGHTVANCQSQYTCRLCQKKHHSTLHDDSEPRASSTATVASRATPTATVASQATPTTADTPAVTSLSATTRQQTTRVLLATATIKVSVQSGRTATVRALLDQGSEATLITENLAQLLRAKRIRRNVTINAVGDIHAGRVKHAVPITVCSRFKDAPSLSTNALVLKSLTSYHPPYTSGPPFLEHLADLQWADTNPAGTEPVQVILGADLYSEAILGGVRKGCAGQPIAQNSIFGWVISGPIQSSQDTHASATQITTHLCAQALPLDDELRRFWEIEELPRQSLLTPLEKRCEEHFRATHSRAPNGRFVVRLPFKQDPPLSLGPSRPAAEKMLNSLQGKFKANPEIQREYSEFMREYEQLGHMQHAPITLPASEQNVYIPHHPVIRDDSTTTHLRVVFNASYITSNGRSLNDHLLSGPKLQRELPDVVLRWRNHRYVYTADIAKMYRQIQIDPRDVNYQRILWRDNATAPIRDYTLMTVTYGMTCAPFLALRVIQRLVELEGHAFPLAVPILQEQIYVDDVLFGGENIESLRQIRNHVIELLRRGKFELRKWASNSTTLLDDIDPSNHGLACTKSLAEDESVKVLGIGWTPSRDVFQIAISTERSTPRTKRTILSTIAKLYDPLGWVTPATVLAKIFMQDLWRLKISWDDTIPAAPLSKWEAIYSELSELNGLSLSRWNGLSSDSVQIELHGFADASTVAYAAAVYLKVISATGTTTVSLLAGKSRVAPIVPVTIPRLELTAAVLLTRLMDFVRKSLGTRQHTCHCWTDSAIVLAWLNDHPSRWKTFVANRVHEIQSKAPWATWKHVPSLDNPADCASRGLLGRELKNCTLWWEGPPWLRSSEDCWPRDAPPCRVEDSLEEKIVTLRTAPKQEPWDLATRYSSWPKLLRVTAYILRFIHCCRVSKQGPSLPRGTGPALSASQCLAARTTWLKLIQRDVFSTEISALSNKQPVSAKSPTAALNPFLDDNGVIRVGGRLRNSPISYQQQHPILLAAHPVVTLIIEQAHHRTLHGGLQLTLSTLRLDFWILRARSQVKQVIHKCVACARSRAQVPEQLMGDLPTPRVTQPVRCFSHCGLDYAGPVRTRTSAGRGCTARKSYIALFICLATRAIHLELVSDYTTEAFRNAFARFCARRGLPTAMYSDNGTTFVGADRELKQAYRSALRDSTFQNSTASDNISWHFIPPSAPHFGGLWEAGVRSVKHHLRRVVGDHTLTFEEFSTLLCRIEACLNSRPLAPLSDAFDNLEPLTAGHFLVGTALTVAPEPSTLHLNENRLSRWQLVRHITEHFWKRWQVDYVNTLQQRSRWRRTCPSLERGQLVLLRNSMLPPCKWELGRIVQLHPGTDGLVRVVTVKTATSEYKRPIVKLCALPVKDDAST